MHQPNDRHKATKAPYLRLDTYVTKGGLIATHRKTHIRVLGSL